MRIGIILLTLLSNICFFVDSSAQTLRLVYNIENTGTNYPIPYLPSFSELPTISSLPDPFEWADGRGRTLNFSDWEARRAEIGAQIQNYEIGVKPVRPDSITASYSGNVLTVHVTVNGKTLTLTSQVILPSGSGPFPAVIGMDFQYGSIPDTIFSSRNIASITFNSSQVSTYGNPQVSNPYYQLYPSLNPSNTGQYSAWAWGVSRIIDGLELVQDVLPVDLHRIAVTGCSYAGKMALFAGAFDERVALTIAQESGGGGATSWRYSHTELAGSVEDIDNTDYNWFMDSMKQFAGGKVSKLPEDHHELMAMCAPRALYATGNPDYTWLSNPSCYVASMACQQIYNGLGIADRFGFSVVGGHSHCQVPNSQIPEIEAFVDKFLLGNDTVHTSFADTPYSTDLSPWITWAQPALSNDTSFFGKTSLVSPPNLQKGLDTTSVTFKWNKASNAGKYRIELSIDPAFKSIAKSDSTTDTLKTYTGLLLGRQYNWRVQVEDNAGSSGPFSNVWNFSTFAPLPAKPLTGSAIPVQGQQGAISLSWNAVLYANQYLVETSNTDLFLSVFASITTSDTNLVLQPLLVGQEYFWRVQASNVTGSGPWSDAWNFTLTNVKTLNDGIPTEYSISQNYPNPFNPTTTIQFGLPRRALTRIAVYDLLGREVQVLIDEELEAGYHEVNVNAVNFSSGVYFYRIEAGTFTQTKKFVLMK